MSFNRTEFIRFCQFGIVIFSMAAEARNRPFFQASRALAMGDAYTANPEGFEAVYYNPAGVAKKNKAQGKYIDLEVLASSAMLGYFGVGLTELGTLAQIASRVAANPGKVHSMGLGIFPQFLVKNFSIGLIARTYSESLVRPTNLELDYYGFTDVALYTHFGVSLMGGVIKIGIGAKALDRAEVERIYTAAEYATTPISFTTQWKEGIGYGIDAGILLTAPVSGLPTLGIAAQDIGNTTLIDRRLIFTGPSGIPGAPQALKQKVNVGFGFSAKHNPGVKSLFGLDVKDVINIGDDYIERLHLGWELDVKKTVYLRAGYNQGRYWTAGLGFQVSGARLEIASYGENLLVGTGARRDDRKYVGRYVLSF